TTSMPDDLPPILELGHFDSLVGESFVVAVEHRELRLELTDAVRLPRHSRRAQDPFALHFVGPAGPQLPQGIHRLRHPRLGQVDVFLVPIGSDDRGVSYEAIFN
ncbi:MAG: hypothetical protein WED87_02315, partial [Dehalococcoidia bacterium]